MVDPDKRTIMLVSNENLPEKEEVLISIFDKYFPDSGKIHELVIPLEDLGETLVKKLVYLNPLLSNWWNSSNDSTKVWSHKEFDPYPEKDTPKYRKYNDSIAIFYQSIKNVLKKEIISKNSVLKIDFGKRLEDINLIKHFEFKVTPELLHMERIQNSGTPTPAVTISYRLDENIINHELTEQRFMEIFVNDIIAKSEKPGNSPEEWRMLHDWNVYPWFIKVIPRLSEMCAICWCEPATFMFTPCGHRVLCQECRYQEGASSWLHQCPICRGEVENIVKYTLDAV